MILHDFKCEAHGVFESTVGKCPHGCGKGMVHKVFLKAPGAMSNKTKFTDKNMRALAKDMGVTDFNNRNGIAEASDFRWNAAKPSNDMMSGKPMAVPVKDIAGFMTENNISSSSGNILGQMKEQGLLTGLKANVVASYNPPKGKT